MESEAPNFDGVYSFNNMNNQEDEPKAHFYDRYRAWKVNRKGASQVNPLYPSSSCLILGSRNEIDALIVTGQISRSILRRTRNKRQKSPNSDGQIHEQTAIESLPSIPGRDPE